MVGSLKRLPHLPQRFSGPTPDPTQPPSGSYVLELFLGTQASTLGGRKSSSTTSATSRDPGGPTPGPTLPLLPDLLASVRTSHFTGQVKKLNFAINFL